MTVPVKAERKIPALLYTSSHHDISILIFSVSTIFSLSLVPSIVPFSGIFLDLLHYCPFQHHTLIYTKTDEGLRR